MGINEDRRHWWSRTGTRRIVEQRPLVFGPAEVCSVGLRDCVVVDLLLREFADVTDRYPITVEGEPPRVAEAPSEDLVESRLAHQWVVVRDCVAAGWLWIDAEDLAVQVVQVPRLVSWVVTAAAIANRDVEVTVWSE